MWYQLKKKKKNSYAVPNVGFEVIIGQKCNITLVEINNYIQIYSTYSFYVFKFWFATYR